MFPSVLTERKSKCTFDSKEMFTMNLELALARNQVNGSLSSRAVPEIKDWLKPPPDFSYKLYISPGISRKQPRKPKVVKKRKPATSTFYEELHRIKSNLSIPSLESQKQVKIITRFPYEGSYEAQLLFVKMGKFKHSKYQDPKPHDFRQYESEKPDFVTSYPRDPLNIKFKSQCLSKIHGLHPVKEPKRESGPKERFITYRPKELKWDAKLFLPKEPWSVNSNSRSAFMERVENTLGKLWLREASQKQAEDQNRRSRGRSRGKVSIVTVSSGNDSEIKQQARKQQQTNQEKDGKMQFSQSTSAATSA